MNHDDDDPDKLFTRTTVLRREFGHAWELWVWLRHQFTPASLGVIATILVTSVGYIVHLNQKVSNQETQITVLETKVLPLTSQHDKLTDMFSNVTIVAQRLVNIDQRLERLEATRDQIFMNTVHVQEIDARVGRLEAEHDQAFVVSRKPVSQFMRRPHK